MTQSPSINLPLLPPSSHPPPSLLQPASWDCSASRSSLSLGRVALTEGEPSGRQLGFLRLSHFFKNNKTSRHHLISAFSCNLFCNCIPSKPDFFLRPRARPTPCSRASLADKELEPRPRAPPLQWVQKAVGAAEEAELCGRQKGSG